MATLPPRKNPTPTRISKQHLTPLQILLQMGFPKHRAEKALAATGNRSVQLANDWLLAHVNDPFLDECYPREYILYACPTGQFHQQLEKFWEQSKEICGLNGAHNYMPHITLVSFFKAPDESAIQLSRTLKQIVELAGGHLDRPLNLELYSSTNFMGFFVGEDDANYLKRLALQYVKEVSNSIISDTYEQLDALVACFPWCGGVTSNTRCIPRSSRSISLDPHVKSLHLTLAYQFPSAQAPALQTLCEKLDPKCTGTNWELRLYSRDARLGSKQVHKVVYSHSPREQDELELRIGDYIYLNGDAAQNSGDGWVDGISWLTGANGYLPVNYVERTAESDAWTKHRTVPLLYKNAIAATSSSNTCGPSEVYTSRSKIGDNKIDGFSCESLDKRHSTKEDVHPFENTPSGIVTDIDSIDVDHLVIEDDLSPLQENVGLSKDVLDLSTSISSMSELKFDQQGESDEYSGAEISNEGERKVFVMRHGERVDFTFGTWVPYCFDDFGNYVQKDLNMPDSLPLRKNNVSGWKKDSPLTKIGQFQASLIGSGLKLHSNTIGRIFCSPSFRCVQTVTSCLDAMGCEAPICIEPGLFEWAAWYQDGLPDWCTPEELTAAGYNINCSYIPIMTINEIGLALKETIEDFYHRSYNVMTSILRDSSDNVFVVGHAASLDTCTRQLVGGQARNVSQMSSIIKKIPYCSIALVTHMKEIGWRIADASPCLPITHSKNNQFIAKILNT